MFRSPARHALALALAAGLTMSRALAAQAPRIALEPMVSGLPGGALWGPTIKRVDEPQTDSHLALRRDTRIARDPMALVGGRLTLATAGGQWRLIVDGGVGRTTLRLTQREHHMMIQDVGPDFVVDGLDLTGRQRATLVQLGVHAERGGRWRGWSTAASGGVMAQRVRTRADSARFVASGFPSGWLPLSGHHYTDPALALGAAIGPSTGALSGLRLAVRSTHVWRSARMINDFERSGYASLDSKGRAWQWQPEASLGWRVWL